MSKAPRPLTAKTNTSLEALRTYLRARDACRKDPYKLAALFGRYGWDDSLHGEIDWCLKVSRFVLVLAPRETWKTSWITELHVVQALLQNPDERILVAHGVNEKATEIVKGIRRYFEHELLHFLFPDIVPSEAERARKLTWNEDGFLVKRRDHLHRELSVQAGSVEKALASGHYTLIVTDDTVCERFSTTKDQREKVKAWYPNTYALLENTCPTKRMWVLGTHWGNDDAYVEMRNGIILAPDGEPWAWYVRRPVENGQSCFPSRYSVEDWEAIRRSKPAAVWAAQYENEPISEARTRFKKIWNRYFDDLPSTATMRLFCDPAFTQKTWSNNSAIVAAALDVTGIIYIDEYILRKLDSDQKADAIFNLYAREIGRKRKPKQLVIEANGAQGEFVKTLRRKMGEVGVWFPIHEVNPQATRLPANKIARIGQLEPKLANEYFRFRHGMKELEDALEVFPTDSERLDLLDAITWILLFDHSAAQTASKSHSQDWKNRKPKFTWGQMPCSEPSKLRLARA